MSETIREIEIASPKSDWTEFIGRLTAGKMVETVRMNVKDEKVNLSEVGMDNVTFIACEWTPKIVKGEGVVAINPEKVNRALAALPDAGSITAIFKDNAVTFRGASRYVKFKSPEFESIEKRNLPPMDKFIGEFEIDAKLVGQILEKAVHAVEQSQPYYTIIYKSGSLIAKIGDFSIDGQEMTFPLASGLALNKEMAEFSSSFNDYFREVLKIGGKVKLHLGDNYPVKIESVSRNMKTTYTIAPAMLTER